jgi:acetyl esterase/lipase
MSDDPLALVARELAPALEFFPEFDFNAGLEPFRQGMAALTLPPLPPELESVRREERWVPSVAGGPEIRVLHYTPPASAEGPRPALLHIHGGGYVLGMPEINDAANRAMALAHGAVVVSVAYRLAPETVWPGALEDCYSVLTWLHDNADTLGIDPARIAVSGESAGGGHAVALALYARDKARGNGKGPSVCFLLLDAPMIDDRTGTGTDPHPHVGQFVWTPEKNRFGWRALLGREPGGPEVPAAAAPARAADLSGLPPAFISVGALDLFLEEDMEFVRRLTRAGVAAELHVVPGAYHGFSMAQGTPQVKQLGELRHAALARAWQSGAETRR